MRVLALIAFLAGSRTASAHEALVEHAHPHGDWMLTEIGLLALGLLAVALVPVLVALERKRR